MVLKILPYALNIPDRVSAERVLAEETRFRDIEHKFLILREDNQKYKIVHQDSCGRHPGYDADECPLWHRES